MISLKKIFLLKKTSIQLFRQRFGGQIASPKLCRLEESVPNKDLFSKTFCLKLYCVELNGSIVRCTSIIIVYSVKIAKLFSRCLCFASQIDMSWLVVSHCIYYERKERKQTKMCLLYFVVSLLSL